MDRIQFNSYSHKIAILLAAVLVIVVISEHAQAQVFSRNVASKTKKRAARNGVRQASASEPATQQVNTPTSADSSDDSYLDDSWSNYLDDPCCGNCCDVNCGNAVGCCGKPAIYAGFESVIVMPRFDRNVAFSTLTEDNNLNRSISETEFDYDFEFSPRVFFGWRHQDNVGLRVTWWQYDHAAATASANPPANGTGLIFHPEFGDVDHWQVDISENDPNHTMTAVSKLKTYAIDLEATHQSDFNSWVLGVGCGIRYAFTEQSYLLQNRDDDNQLRGQINYNHSLEGIGPTISLEAFRPVTGQVSIFGKARGSLLFDDGRSTLVAGEDLDTSLPATTTKTTNRDDLLSIAEIQLGLQWKANQKRGRSLRPFLTVAMEGQVWNGAGNAVSEEGDLGFYGLNSGAGVEW